VLPAARWYFSFISYATKEVDITGKTTVDVKMDVAAKDLTEVVVTGS